MESYYYTKDSIWNDKFECDLMLEQGVACIRGCQMYQDNLEDRMTAYGNCVDDCDTRYYLEFDRKGNINYCEYQWVV